MPLGEAMVYLKRAVKRRFGTDVAVRFVDVESEEAEKNGWKTLGPLPLVIVDGKVFSKGTMSYYQITQKLYSLRNNKRR